MDVSGGCDLREMLVPISVLVGGENEKWVDPIGMEGPCAEEWVLSCAPDG